MSIADQGLAAYSYAAEQLWDLRYGLVQAYQVDTGRNLDWEIRPWSRLTEREQLAFTCEVLPVLKELNAAAMRARLA